MKLFKVLGLSLCIVLLIFGLNTLKTSNNFQTENILQTEKAANNIKYIKAEDIEIATDKWKTSPYGCVKKFFGDSFSSISALAVNQKYLAVGDSKKNRITIYNHSDSGKWLKAKEVFPPEDSVAYKVGSGFGSALALDKNILVIGAYTEQLTSKVTNPNDFQERSTSRSISQAIYTANLENSTKVERIEIPKNNLVDSHSITADGGRIAFVTLRKAKFRPEINIVNILSLSGKKKQYISIPPNSRKGEPDFNLDIELKNHLLLVGSPSVYTGGSGLLFNLNEAKKKPIRLAAPNAVMGKTVALADRFAAVGSSSEFGLLVSAKDSPKTLIRSIKNGSTTVIDGYGELFLYKNILLRQRNRTPGTLDNSVLEIFRLSDNGIPHLIEKYTNNITWSQKGFLITAKKIASVLEICSVKMP